jgi:hypothetical protein
MLAGRPRTATRVARFCLGWGDSSENPKLQNPNTLPASAPIMNPAFSSPQGGMVPKERSKRSNYKSRAVFLAMPSEVGV